MGKEVEEMEVENTLINRNAKLECSLRLLLWCVFFFFLSSQVRRRSNFVLVENLPDLISDTQVLVPVFNLPAKQYSLEERNFVMGFKWSLVSHSVVSAINAWTKFPYRETSGSLYIMPVMS